ncbi:MarR family winged helix-turn-helix transcriptional regulator [Geothrix sp.]|jgi:DNA-binding MarR family transcriptional regulator|uniref:MarR family winged helix-turn-helix transcriptional regulator n=1 Tax=Geothrix sp. TaxID=1962974 RepID=UPI0025C208CE|nr:MarR family winged helix-turn-helix transcriptional regulator [Geothrix sp.]
MQEQTPLPTSEVGLGVLASAVRRRLKQVVWARLTPYGLSPQQLWVMLVLLEKGPSSLHPLAQQVWMDDPTASRVVKAMVGRGWLTTMPDPHHGRRILIDLAPEALPLARELGAMTERLKESLVTGLNEQERAIVRHGLQTMLGNLDDLLAAGQALGSSEAAAS